MELAEAVEEEGEAEHGEERLTTGADGSVRVEWRRRGSFATPSRRRACRRACRRDSSRRFRIQHCFFPPTRPAAQRSNRGPSWTVPASPSRVPRAPRARRAHHPRGHPRGTQRAFHSGVTRRASRRPNATQPWRDARAPRMRPVPRDQKIPRRWAHPRRRRGVAERRDVGTPSRRDGTDRVERSAARESRIATAARMPARVELECAREGERV